LSIKTREYILAAQGLGFSYARILFGHVIPNSLTPVLVSAPMKVGEVILLESALSFLGLGVQPPTPSWGNIIHDGFSCLSSAWWISAFPGILIVLTVMSFNVIADALMEKTNPNKTR
jgi:peptide/nickel transport system permease protein